MTRKASLNFHPKCIARLEEVLTDAGGKLEVVCGVLIGWQGLDVLRTLNGVVPAQDNLPVPLKTMIDERLVSDFAADRIGRRLSDVDIYCEMGIPAPEPLVDSAPFADPGAIARQVVAEFASLPWEHPFSLRLPCSIGSVMAP